MAFAARAKPKKWSLNFRTAHIIYKHIFFYSMYSTHSLTNSFFQNRSAASQVLTVRSLSEFEFCQLLKDVQLQLEAGCTDLTLDLSSLKIINSVGLNFLLSVRHRTNHLGTRLTLANPSAAVLRLLEITKLKPFFHLQETTSNNRPEYAPLCGAVPQAA